MQVTVSVRHCTVADELRTRAESLVDRLAHLTPFAQDGTVVFDSEPLRQSVEIRFRLTGGQVLVATGEADDHRTALDRAEQRMRRQLTKPAARPGRGRRGATQA
jgi:ribosomal subunit interface protein